MLDEKLERKVYSATKWSTLAEGIARLISPITNMILARLLAPEAFGIIATITMLTSFADIFTDAGFQKYLVQHEFATETQLFHNANVAFWTNMVISIMLWGFIAVFCTPIANIIGSSGYEIEMVIACLQLPITSFSSIQRAMYRRQFDFKSLFYVRIITASIPLIVTVPFAWIGMGHWALIIGNLARVLIYAAVLTKKSRWKPGLFYSFKLLQKMFSYSIWTLIESIEIWFNDWVDIFIIGNTFTAYYLGIYKNSQQLVNALMSLITAIVVPIMFSALSRLQNNDVGFQNFFYRFQRTVAYIVFPLGTGLFIFRDFAVHIMMGNKWNEASMIVGLWSLTSCILIVCSNFYIEVYRAKGRPRLSVITQAINLGLLIPACLISKNFGFWFLIYTRAAMRLVNILIGIIIMTCVMKFRLHELFLNLLKPFLLTFIMCGIAVFIKPFTTSYLQQALLIIVCASVYFFGMYLEAKNDWEYMLRLFVKKNN